MPGFQEFSDSIVSFVNDETIIKINGMVIGPRLMCNPRAFGHSFDVPYTFFFLTIKDLHVSPT